MMVSPDVIHQHPDGLGHEHLSMADALVSGLTYADIESQILIEKGFVPKRSKGPFGELVTWDRPSGPPIPWQTVIVLIGLMLMVLAVAWGRPW